MSYEIANSDNFYINMKDYASKIYKDVQSTYKGLVKKLIEFSKPAHLGDYSGSSGEYSQAQPQPSGGNKSAATVADDDLPF